MLVLYRFTRPLLVTAPDRLCREEDGRGLFGKYPHLKKLHHARTNLAVTSQLSEFFYTIPQRAEDLTKYVCVVCTYFTPSKCVFIRHSFVLRRCSSRVRLMSACGCVCSFAVSPLHTVDDTSTIIWLQIVRWIFFLPYEFFPAGNVLFYVFFR